MKIKEYDNAAYYKLNCGCDDDDHMTTIVLEYHKDTDNIDLTFYQKMSIDSYWGCDHWYQRIWKRIRTASKMLFTGWLEHDTTVLLKDRTHIESFIEALNEGKEKIKN